MHCFVILYKGLRHPRILGCVRACVCPGTSPSIKRADCSRVVGTQVIGGFSMARVSRSLTPVLFKGQLCFPCQP